MYKQKHLNMIRVDTDITKNIIKKLDNFSQQVNWNGNEYIGNLNNVFFDYNLSKSTSSIYITIRNNDTFEQTQIRLSNHCRSLRYDSKDYDIDFDEFNIELVKKIYNTYKL